MAQAEHPVGPANIWGQAPSFKESKFFAEYLNRLVCGRDMHVIITASSETGVGKTTLAVSLALLLDQHGWTADKASVADAKKYDNLYDQVDPGSVLILDEAEKAVDSRRGMSSANVDLSQSFAAKRYRQVFAMMTAPSKSWVDKRIGGDSADYWIQTQETDMGRVKGEAIVYRLKTNEHYQQDYTKRTEQINWPNLDWHPEFKALDRRKREYLEGPEESLYVHKREVSDIKESVRKETRRSTETEIMVEMHDAGIAQKTIAEVFDLHQSTVSRRINDA